MSNPPSSNAGNNSTSPFGSFGSFGQKTSNNATSLSGNNDAPASGGGIFGSTTNPTTQAPSPFGNLGASKAAQANTSGLFGGGGTTGGTPMFGVKSIENNTSSTSKPLFGQPSTASQNTFGGAAPASSSTATPLFGQPSTATQNTFGGAAPASSSTPTSMFSQPTTATQSTFGGAQTASKDGASTPTATKTSFSFGAPSTTPAGPPPTGPQSNPLRLGGQSGSAPSSLFGNTASTKQGDSSASPFPGTSFSNNNPPQSQAAPSAASPMFGSGASTGNNLFGAANSAQRSLGATSTEKSTTTASDQTAVVQSTEQAISAKPSLFGAPASTGALTPTGPASTFGGIGAAKQDSGKPSPFAFPSTAASTAQSGSTQPNFNFPPATTSAPAAANSTATTTSAPQANSLFGAPSSAAAPTTNPFGNLGQKKDAAATESNSTAAASNPSAPAVTSTTAPAAGATASLFGATNSNTATAQTTTASAAANSDTTKSAAPAASGLGNSTAGPAPSAQSRLKNKSMDEIITRWASDLSKYQKEFQSQAERVSSWDRMLVENGNAISKLYSRTFQAERDTAELQRQLSAVEGHQEELSQWLDRYEREVDEMLARQVGQNDGVQGPDQERERTYKTAEKVSERLNEMGQNLTGMIDEINVTSSSIQKTSKPDDPLSKIVRILNGHLSQLQTIDQGTSVLQEKVAAAQKESQRLGYRGHRGPGSDAVDDFYRSYSRRA